MSYLDSEFYQPLFEAIATGDEAQIQAAAATISERISYQTCTFVNPCVGPPNSLRTGGVHRRHRRGVGRPESKWAKV